MLEEVISAICSAIMAISGLIIIHKLIDRNDNIFTKNNILLLSIMIFVTVILYKINYTSTYTILIYLVNIIIYKLIFKNKIIESFIFTSIMMIITFFADILTMIVLIPFVNINELRSVWYIRLLATNMTAIFSVVLTKILLKSNKIKNILQKTDKFISNKNFIFLSLLMIVFFSLAYNFYSEFGFNIGYVTNIIIAVIFIVLLIIYFREKDNYLKLSDKYDSMFYYVQTFEDWIEKEQLNRHEFKNQLAVLRSVTKDKNTKKKIDEILKDNIEIEDEIIDQLKHLPKGGIKGLMYYKSAIAQKNKLNLVIDVSINNNSVLNNLNKNDTQTLCKLIGIYYDNAIEAAKETRKKNILIEIYEIKNQTNIVISNTFKKSRNFNNRNEKGISSKGKGRGNGLYFAKSLLDKNKWIEENQEIIDRYYIETLHIKTRK